MCNKDRAGKKKGVSWNNNVRKVIPHFVADLWLGTLPLHSLLQTLFFLSLLDSSKHKLHHSFSLLFSLIYDWQSESCHKWSSISSLHLMMVFPLMDLFANPLLKVLRNFLLCFLNEEPGETSFVDSRQNDVNIYCLWQQNVAIDTGQTIF